MCQLGSAHLCQPSCQGLCQEWELRSFASLYKGCSRQENNEVVLFSCLGAIRESQSTPFTARLPFEGHLPLSARLEILRVWCLRSQSSEMNGSVQEEVGLQLSSIPESAGTLSLGNVN